MDNFISLAKQGYQAYEASQGSHQQGGDRGDSNDDRVQDRRHHESPGVPDLDHDEVVDRASEHAGDSGDSSLFSSAMKHLSHHSSEHTKPLDEDHVTNSHKEAYERGNAGGLDADSMGSAAALQALKMFTSGGGSGGGGGTTQMVSLAMSEASKLFDSSGGASSGGKQEVVNSASMYIMKMVVKSKVSGMIGGGNSGGLGPLMGLAGKFM